jgi:hypothetical protein
MGTAATTASADYALMGSTAKTNDRTHTGTLKLRKLPIESHYDLM